MCGRLDQSELDAYLADFSWADELVRRSGAESTYNASPGMMRPVLHVEGGALMLDDMFWGYQAPWATGKVPVARNARLDKITGRYWATLLKRGRCVVPASGWYEWTGDKGSKQAWHLHRADGKPLYLAALACFDAPESASREARGFVLVTDDAQGGMVDIHDRRPVAFTAEDASSWMDPAMPPEMAEQLARQRALGPDAFAWHKETRDMNTRAKKAPPLQL